MATIPILNINLNLKAMDILTTLNKEKLNDIDRYGVKLIEINYRKFNQVILCYKYKLFYYSIKQVDGKVVQAYKTIFKPRFIDDWIEHPTNELKPLEPIQTAV